MSQDTDQPTRDGLGANLSFEDWRKSYDFGPVAIMFSSEPGRSRSLTFKDLEAAFDAGAALAKQATLDGCPFHDTLTSAPCCEVARIYTAALARQAQPVTDEQIGERLKRYPQFSGEYYACLDTARWVRGDKNP